MFIIYKRDQKNSPRWIFADFCEIISKTIITPAKIHFFMNLFQVIMTIDLTKQRGCSFHALQNSVQILFISSKWPKFFYLKFLVKKQAPCNFIKKETLAQVFSCEFCKISNNTFYRRTPLMAAFVY